MQASTGYLQQPESLHPEQNEQRTTFSASYQKPLGTDYDYWAATLAYSIKDLRPGPALHAVLAETALHFAQRNALFARFEHKQDAELSGDEQTYGVTKLSFGYSRALSLTDTLQLDVGGLVSAYAIPTPLKASYGGGGVKSFMLFTRVGLGGKPD
jgi:hypothetical protein